MLNTAILITTLLVLVVSVKRLYRTLTVGSMEQLVKRGEDALTKLKEDEKLNDNSKEKEMR